MKFLVLALLVAAATAAPLDAGSDPVELIVNGVSEGHPLEISDIVDITLNEHADGEVVAQSNLLYPLTAIGLAEAAAAAAAQESKPEENTPESVAVIDATPDVPAVEVAPETPSVVDASPVVPETPIVVDASPESPTVVDASPVIPETPAVVDVAPEVPAVVDVVPEAPVSPVEVVEVEAIPEPAAQEALNGEIYNDGMVQVQVNYPQEAGVIGTLKSWVSLALNYFQSGVPTSQQII